MVKPLGIAEISANTSKFAESDWDSASHRRYIKKAVWNESRWLHNAVYVVDCSTSVAELVVEYSEPTAMSAHRVDEALAIIIASGWSAVK